MWCVPWVQNEANFINFIMSKYRLTTGFAEVKPYEDKDDAANEAESNKVKFRNMLPEALAMMWVQVQEEKEDCERNASSRPENNKQSYIENAEQLTD